MTGPHVEWQEPQATESQLTARVEVQKWKERLQPPIDTQLGEDGVVGSKSALVVVSTVTKKRIADFTSHRLNTKGAS